MNNENLPDFNYHSGEDVPYISISNSKSNSSKNQNSKTSSNMNKLSLTQNNNNSSSNSRNNQDSPFKVISNKTLENSHKEEKSSGNSFFRDTYYVQNIGDTSFNIQNISNQVNSEDKKEKKIERTPNKIYDKNNAILEKLKNKNKAVLSIDNFDGRNLNDYFEKIYVNATTENKNKNQVSSIENSQNNTIKLKKNKVNINKSWNKNSFINFQIKPVKAVNKYNKSFSKKNNEIKNRNNSVSGIPKIKNNKMLSCVNITSLNNNLQNLFKLNSAEIKFNNLLNKYRPKKKIIKKNNNTILNYQNNLINNNNNKCNNDKNKINTLKRFSQEKIKPIPKSDIYNRKFSLSHLKITDSVKNLFQEKKSKQNKKNSINKDMRKFSAKVTKVNKPLFSSTLLKDQKNKPENLFCNLLNSNTAIRIKQYKKETNNLFLKYKEKNEFEKTLQPKNKRFNYNIKK